MNHLAHALLAGDDEALRLGGMLGDFVHGRPDATVFPPRVIAGIRLHRAIDVYTDAHPEVLAARALLPAPYRRYAGILLDMWFDRCLARDFPQWSAQPLAEYSAALRVLLWRQDPLLPPALRRFRGYMEAHGLPAAYTDDAVLDEALGGIGQRLRRANPLASALPVLLEREAELQRRFEAFFPELREFAQTWVEAYAE
ncbi:MAG: ACP phosphodiesterase [Rhodanobacter sp.]|uniref:acyl carrier protein phosphodiesterase n=1 Tax=Rhodanobacter sp. KK11 TaxID=3083255 RepID=UPI002966009A|nr:ACP phosphodiesterase [Rhodanobacter sp. KK11]MDW2983096.1 ACP phosphodiesterase [Rhodanobacter sp. KK11]